MASKGTRRPYNCETSVFFENSLACKRFHSPQWRSVRAEQVRHTANFVHGADEASPRIEVLVRVSLGLDCWSRQWRFCLLSKDGANCAAEEDQDQRHPHDGITSKAAIVMAGRATSGPNLNSLKNNNKMLFVDTLRLKF
jgi:hypothetical protein